MKQKKLHIKLSWLIKGSEERAILAQFLKTMLGDMLADKAGFCCPWMPSPFAVRIVAHQKMLKQLITGGGPQKAEELENMDCDSKLHLENHSRKPSRDHFFLLFHETSTMIQYIISGSDSSPSSWLRLFSPGEWWSRSPRREAAARKKLL